MTRCCPFVLLNAEDPTRWMVGWHQRQRTFSCTPTWICIHAYTLCLIGTKARDFSKRRSTIRPRLCISTRVLCFVVMSKVTSALARKPRPEPRKNETERHRKRERERNIIFIFVILRLLCPRRIFSEIIVPRDSLLLLLCELKGEQSYWYNN